MTAIINCSLFICISMLLHISSCAQGKTRTINENNAHTSMPNNTDKSNDDSLVFPISKTEEEWKSMLSEEAYKVLRLKGTDRPFTGDYWNNHEAGTYLCRACNAPLYSSDTKFDSGTGWPSYWSAIDPKNIKLIADGSLGMQRIELLCAQCGGHLGHLFDDGPKPTGQRHCINSSSLKFIPK